MPARTTRQAARERLRAIFEAELDQMIPPDEQRPLRGRLAGGPPLDGLLRASAAAGPAAGPVPGIGGPRDRPAISDVWDPEGVGVPAVPSGLAGEPEESGAADAAARLDGQDAARGRSAAHAGIDAAPRQWLGLRLEALPAHGDGVRTAAGVHHAVHAGTERLGGTVHSELQRGMCLAARVGLHRGSPPSDRRLDRLVQLSATAPGLGLQDAR